LGDASNPGSLKLTVLEEDGTKCILVSEREEGTGLAVNLAAIPDLRVGDKITVTGRVGAGAPFKSWAVSILRIGINEASLVLVQHSTPAYDELFHLSHILSAEDIKQLVHIRTSQWLGETANVDIYVDSILISRNIDSTQFQIDSRTEVYNLANDQINSTKVGDITDYIVSAGEPAFNVTEQDGQKHIHITSRVNDWDGIDIQLALMNLVPGNKYTVKVKGRSDGVAQPGADIILQTVPGFIWRKFALMQENRNFELVHTFSPAEVQTTEVVRIATNGQGATVPFTIFGIEIINEGVEQND